jgi:hypothetical protein
MLLFIFGIDHNVINEDHHCNTPVLPMVHLSANSRPHVNEIEQRHQNLGTKV